MNTSSTRFVITLIVNLLGFAVIAASLTSDATIATQAISSVGLVLTVVNGGFMGSKVAEHGTRFLGSNNEK